MSDDSPAKIGLVLGSGASRGWSHIGVLKALVREGIEPDIVCGTSIGAMIGAAWLAGNLEKLEQWVLDATQLDVIKFFEIQFTKAGFVDTQRLKRFLHNNVVAESRNIEDLGKPFAAVATDVNSGREVWFTEGNAADAVRASMALPALFPTVNIDGRWFVDGGLVNPVPVSVCRALGADFIVAVNLNADIIGKRPRKTKNDARDESDADQQGFFKRMRKSARDYSESLFANDDEPVPGLFDVVASSINIFQDRITRSRLAGDPADVLIAPKLAHIGLLDFQRAGEAIREGEERTMRALEDIRKAIEGN